MWVAKGASLNTCPLTRALRMISNSRNGQNIPLRKSAESAEKFKNFKGGVSVQKLVALAFESLSHR
jgi:hypothetical protein